MIADVLRRRRRKEFYWATLMATNDTFSPQRINTDGQGFTYQAGYKAPSGYVAKFDSRGELVWHKSLVSGGTNLAVDIDTDSNGNIYLAGYTASGGVEDCIIIKLNSSGTLLWQRRIGTSGSNQRYNSVYVADDNTIYLAGRTMVHSSFLQNGLITRINGSGTVQWHRELGSSATFTYTEFVGIDVDSSGFIYVAGATDITRKSILAKYNSSGTLQWRRHIEGSGTQAYFTEASVDSNGDVYVAGVTNHGGSTTGLVAKYNGSGTLQWHRVVPGGSLATCNGAEIIGDKLFLTVMSNVAFEGSSTGKGIVLRCDLSGIIESQMVIRAGDHYGIARGTINKKSATVRGPSAGLSGHSSQQVIVSAPRKGSLIGSYSLGSGQVKLDEASLLASNAGSLSTASITLSASTISLSSLSTSISIGTPTNMSYTTIGLN